MRPALGGRTGRSLSFRARNPFVLLSLHSTSKLVMFWSAGRLRAGAVPIQDSGFAISVFMRSDSSSKGQLLPAVCCNHPSRPFIFIPGQPVCNARPPDGHPGCCESLD